MSNDEPRGRMADAFVGKSIAEYEGDESTDEALIKPATLQEALDDVAVQAASGGYRGKKLRVVYVEFVPENPHLKEISVIATPGA